MGRESRTRITATNTASAVFNKVASDAGKMASGFARVTDVASNLTIVTAGLSRAMTGLANAAAVPIKAAIEQERVEAQLGAVLKSTGEAANLNAEALLDMASSFQDLTTESDQAVLAAQNILLTFTQIGGDGGIFERTTGVVLDMSAALGTNLKEQSIQVGKALNDPIKGVGALAEVGVTFTAKQKDMIAALVETGDVAGAQTVILDELSKEFGGSAVAARDTFGGALKSLGNQWDSLLEAAGRFVTENEGVRDIIADITEVVGEWASEIDGLSSSSEAQASVANVLRGAIVGVLDVVQGMNTAFAFLGEVILETVQDIAALTGETLPLTRAQRELADEIEHTKEMIEGLQQADMVTTLVGEARAAEDVAAEMGELNEVLMRQEIALANLIDEGIDLSSTADAMNDRLETLAEKLSDTSDEADDAAESLEAVAEAATEVSTAIADLAPETSLRDLQEAREEIQSLLGDMRNAPSAFDAWSRSWEKLRVGMVGLDLEEQLRLMNGFSKELAFQAGHAKDFTARTEETTVALEGSKDTMLDLGDVANDLQEKFADLFGDQQPANIEEMTSAILDAEQEWLRSVENMGRSTSSEFSGIFEDWAGKQQDLGDGFEDFGQSIRETMADAFFEPIVGAESAFADLFTAVLTPVKQLGKAIGDQIFGELIRGVLKYFGVKKTQEAADAAASTGIQGAQALATVAQQQAAVTAMMPGLAAAASASLVATLGGAAAAASLLPGILGTAAAAGKASAAALAIPLAEGGIFDQSTFANIGEDGLELALPLTKPARVRALLDEVDRRLPGSAGGRGGSSSGIFAPVSITVNGGGMDPEVLADMIGEKVDEHIGRTLSAG